MIFAFKSVFALITIVLASSVVKFPIERIDHRQFIAGIIARAAKGIQ